MTELIKSMISNYKNNGDRVDEVLFQEVMKVVERAQELENLDGDMHLCIVDVARLEKENKRLREQLKLINSDTYATAEHEKYVSLKHLIRKRVDKALEDELLKDK